MAQVCALWRNKFGTLANESLDEFSSVRSRTEVPQAECATLILIFDLVKRVALRRPGTAHASAGGRFHSNRMRSLRDDHGPVLRSSHARSGSRAPPAAPPPSGSRWTAEYRACAPEFR